MYEQILMVSTRDPVGT